MSEVSPWSVIQSIAERRIEDFHRCSSLNKFNIYVYHFCYYLMVKQKEEA